MLRSRWWSRHRNLRSGSHNLRRGLHTLRSRVAKFLPCQHARTCDRYQHHQHNPQRRTGRTALGHQHAMRPSGKRRHAFGIRIAFVEVLQYLVDQAHDLLVADGRKNSWCCITKHAVHTVGLVKPDLTPSSSPRFDRLRTGLSGGRAKQLLLVTGGAKDK